mgnify:FL=1
MFRALIIFLVLNAAALGLGGLFTGPGVESDWYQGLDKAPWTPPGWVFGAAWTSIMLAFAVFMAVAWTRGIGRTELIALYGLQWVLNVGWNAVFFQFQAVGVGLLVILALTALVVLLMLRWQPALGSHVFWALPYVVWLLVAISLNAYVWVQNPA